MAQPDHDPDRHKSRGRKERTPAQLAVLVQAREKAKIVIAERAKIYSLAKKDEAEPVSEEAPPPPEPEDETPPPEPEAVWEESHPPPPPPPPEHVPVSENEDEEPRLTRPKYHYINGMYIKIK